MDPNRFYFKDGAVSEFPDPDNTLHREDGPAIIIHDETKIMIDDVLIEGPAVAWLFDNQLHCEVGPALESNNGKRYFIFGVEIDEDDFLQITQGSEAQASRFLDGTKAERYLAERRLEELASFQGQARA